MNDLPTIDIAPLGQATAAAATVAADLAQACHEVGFVCVSGHGIDRGLIEQVRRQVIALFSLPLGQRQALAITHDNYRGYIPLGFFSANAGGAAPDHYEGYKLHAETAPDDPICRRCSLYGPNKWPAQLPQLRTAVLAYWAECDRVSGLLLDALAQQLAIDPQLFRRAFDQPLTNITLLHYPPPDPRQGGAGIHAHKDTDVLTLLAPDPVGGLWVKRRGSAGWLRADAPADTLIVNIGDLLELWSGGYFVSTPHQVVNPGHEHRYSFPYFAVPRFDTVVAPVCPPQPGFDRAPRHVGDISAEVWRTNWLDAEPADSALDLGTVAD